MAYEDLTPAERGQLYMRVQRESEYLAEEFTGIFGKETIERFVNESFASLQNANLIDFVPTFVRRFARERLRATAQAEGLVTKDIPEVLYVCVHNAGRSQMAAMLTQSLGGERVNVRSAGSEPASSLNQRVVEAMAEVGLDISQEFPKPLTDEVVRAADVVITMGCGDACPIYPGKRYLDWELDDPAELDIEGVRRVREEIRGRVEQLLVELGVTSAA